MDATDFIHFERRGLAGIVTLDRPAALNALSHAIVRALARRLTEWAADPQVETVVVRGRGRAFCAGGDIRAVYEAGRQGPPAIDFFRDEYRLNAAVKHFPKPYVALVHGYVMGGGAGISIHGRYRVFAADAVFSMPETGIGFFPDIGGSHFLSRMPASTGVYCALAAARLGRGDCLHTGIATHAAPADRFDAIVDALAGEADVEAVLAHFTEPAPPPETLGAVDPVVAEVFGTGGVETILARLDQVDAPHAAFAARAAAAIRTKSPTSLRIALRQVRAAAALDFDDCIRLDFRIVNEILSGHDFYEGVRAALVDRDGVPHWRPATLPAVDERAVERHFLPPRGGDLVFA
ncbi:enoyl-CoA hydratase/isomerase family protein [Prosthecomicrobium pneumaticum]|uniref:3-hydroxyisobutyryl-CoA hydrolase n=1 Tax=Prosthecomicrobium pneumaticum TaxID=81895 RepID=A0A7W9L3P1_9HYPH|nr:enoyl-CoA hydratase/isomerase family protein [Prosthecomicrobium pneumaticum]MBB5754745.1 enoyl-CoA hydratase [Prosthecomicrobium pneumaticum]